MAKNSLKYNLKYFRKEMLLDINQYLQPAEREELEALAQTIQNLIIIRKGTIPNDPLMGVGIADYLFEILDSQLINEIQMEIEKQISRYIIYTNSVVSVTVSKVSTAYKDINSLKVSVFISSIKSLEEEDVVEIEMLFAGNNNTKEVVSKLLTS